MANMAYEAPYQTDFKGEGRKVRYTTKKAVPLGSYPKGQLKSRYGFISVSAFFYGTTAFGGE